MKGKCFWSGVFFPYISIIIYEFDELRIAYPFLKGHDTQTTTQGTGSTRALQPWGGLRWPRGSGQQTSSSQTRWGLQDGSPAAPALGTGQWQSKGRDCTCTEG